MNDRRKALIALSILLLGCDERPDSHTAAAPLAAPAAEVDAERKSKAERDVVTEAVTPAIDWSSAKNHPRLPEALAPRHPEFAKLSIPALLPHVPELLAVAKITVKPTWYTASMTRDGHNVLVQGRHVALVVPGSADAPEPKSPPSFEVRTNELAKEVAFGAFGAAYSVMVECDAPETDPRCTQDGYVLGLAMSLCVVPVAQ